MQMNDSANEMVLVQTGTEDRFENYLRNRKEILSLSYPGPKTRDGREFAQFFESPFRVERRRNSFRGCLVINLSEYLEDCYSPRLKELASYIASNPDAEYVMYAEVSDMKSGTDLIHRMRDLTGCRELCFRNQTDDTGQSVSAKKTTRTFGY